MLRKLLLLTLLLPAPAFADFAPTETVELRPSQTRTVYEHTWGNSATNSDLLDVSSCELVEGQFDPSRGDASTDATVLLRACRDSGDALSSCRTMTFSPASETEWFQLNASEGYVAADAITGTSGTDVAAARIRCTTGESAGTTKGPFGIVGTTGTEETWAALGQIGSFQKMPSVPKYYFSNNAGGRYPLGVDSSPDCSTLAPCLTVDKCHDILEQGPAECVFDEQDTFTDEFPKLDLDNCTGGFCGAVSGADYSGGTRATIDCSGFGGDIASEAGVFDFADTTGTETRWFLIQNLDIVGSGTNCLGWDAVFVGGNVRVVWLNGRSAMANSALGSGGHGPVAKENGAFIGLNNQHSLIDDVTANGNEVFVVTQTSSTSTNTAVGICIHCAIDQADTAVGTNSGFVVRNDGNAKTFLGSTTVTNSGGAAITNGSNISQKGTPDTHNNHVTAVRTVIDGARNDTSEAQAAWRTNGNAGLNSACYNQTLREVTFGPDNSVARYLSTNGCGTWDEMFSAADNQQSTTVSNIWCDGDCATAEDAGTITITISKTVRDEDDVGNDASGAEPLVRHDTTNENTCDDAIDPSTGTFNESRHNMWDDCDSAYDSGTEGVDGTIYSPAAQSVCDPSTECGTAAAVGEGYSVTLPSDVSGDTVCIPEWVLGQEVCSFNLKVGGSSESGNLGAR